MSFRVLLNNWEQNGHSALLGTIVILTLVNPFVTGHPSMNWLMVLVLLAILLAAMRTLTSSHWEFRIALVLAVIASMTQFGDFVDDSAWLDLVRLITWLAFLSLVCLVLLRDLVVRSLEVNAELILGSINIYLLVGLAFAFLYGLMEFLQPGSFSGIESSDMTQEPMPHFIYFSYVTLTTLGYGDITPFTPLAKTMSYTEAVAGQLYLAILVARLVGLYISRQARKPG